MPLHDMPDRETHRVAALQDVAEVQHGDQVYVVLSQTSSENETSKKGRIPETTLQCIRYLRQVSPVSTISVEVEKPNREGLTELAAEADVVFYSRSWAEVSLSPTKPEIRPLHAPACTLMIPFGCTRSTYTRRV